MKGKVKLRIGRKSSFWNRRYRVFLNGDLVGNLDYRSPQISFGANPGDNQLVVKSKAFEKELSLNIPPEKLILPIEIKENWGANNPDSKTSKLIKGVKIGFLIVYAFAIAYLQIFEHKYNMLSAIIPLLLLLSLISSYRKVEPFRLDFKKF